MKRINKLIIILMNCILVLGLLGGCGKKVTAEEVLINMVKNSKQVKSMEGEFNLDMDLGVEESGVSMNLGAGMDGTIEAINEPAAMHMKAGLNIDLMNLKVDFELYSTQEDGKTVIYAKFADQWKKMEEENGEEADQLSADKYDLQSLLKEGIELSDKTEKVNEQEVYVLSGEISGEKLEKPLAAFKEAIENSGQTIDLKKADIPVTLKVYKESGLPAVVELDVSRFVNTIFEAAYKEAGSTTNIKTDECRLVITFTEYDGIESIKVPEEAKDAAEENVQTLMKDMEDQSALKEQETSETDEFELGLTEGNTYTSEFLGVSCTVPDSWAYYSPDQLKEMNSAVYDTMGDNPLKEALAKADIIYDMYVMDSSSGQNINIAIENMEVSYGTILDESSYLDMSIEMLKSGLESTGVTDITTERNTVEMAGEKREGLMITSNLQGNVMYQQIVPIRKGNHMACITFTCFNNNTLDEMSKYFTTLK